MGEKDWNEDRNQTTLNFHNLTDSRISQVPRPEARGSLFEAAPGAVRSREMRVTLAGYLAAQGFAGAFPADLVSGAHSASSLCPIS